MLRLIISGLGHSVCLHALNVNEQVTVNPPIFGSAIKFLPFILQLHCQYQQKQNIHKVLAYLPSHLHCITLYKYLHVSLSTLSKPSLCITAKFELIITN